MASKISLVKSFTNTEQVPCLVHMNVIVNILYLHIYKITVCSVDCSFNVLLRQSQGYNVKEKKKKGLCYITEEEAAQTCLRCTITCNHDDISKG